MTARRELALQIEVDVAWYHMIALRINLMNISAVTIFLARVVYLAKRLTKTFCVKLVSWEQRIIKTTMMSNDEAG